MAVVAQNLVHETSFCVMPDQCNFLYPMIFGGAFFAELDKAAAVCAYRLLHHSDCDRAVTHKFEDGQFLAAAYAGDVIFIKAEVIELRKKAIVIQTIAHREKRGEPGRDLIAKVKFIFISMRTNEDDGKAYYAPHNLEMPE